MRGKIRKEWLLIFLVVWMMNCASDDEREDVDNSAQMITTKKEKPADEVDLAPRPTRVKK